MVYNICVKIYGKRCLKIKDLTEFEKKIEYSFKDIELLKTALTHTSYAYEKKIKSNERLEYLGDSILEFVSSKYLFKHYNNLSEGEMTKVRAYAVCENSLYEVALKLDFSDFLYLGKSEQSTKTKKKAILADSVEAVIAAIYLDSNIEEAEKFILKNLKDTIEFASHNVGLKDYKTVLQERLQVNGDVKIVYNIIAESGPDHEKLFTAEVECNGEKLAVGVGRSKKLAEMEAAKKSLEKLDK